MWVFDANSLRFLEVNDAAVNTYGYSRDQFMLMTVSDIRPPEDRELHREFVRETARSTYSSSTMWRHLKADGTVIYVDIISNHVVFDGKLARIVLAMDASARLGVARALSESRAALNEAQELAHLGSFDVDLRTGTATWSSEMFRIVGLDPEQDLPALLYDFDHPEDAPGVRAEIERSKRDRLPYTVEHRIITKDGRERYVFERGQFFFDGADPKPHRLIGAVLDITDRKHAEEQLRHIAQHDSLTDLANRSLLERRLVSSIDRARAQRSNVAVLFIDLDRFKTVNDTMTHTAGDWLLREVAFRLRHAVEGRGTVARQGGDEFIIVLDDIAREEDALHAARALLSSIAAPLPYEGTKLLTSASIGIAFFPQDGVTPAELLRNADAAMYAAKARGGNAIECFTPELRRTALADMELERALRDLLERDGIEVHYQPIVDARTGRLCALEALARWRTETGFVSPDRFIPLAEETGLILRLGASVLEKACNHMRSIAHLCPPNAVIAVNVSAREIREADFGASVQRVLQRTRLPANRLQLEITESAYMSGEAGMRNIRALKELGIQLSIDDFGTGYSSLGYLKHLPVDALKIDRSFVSDILTDVADQAILRAIIAVAKHLGLGTIAEGVETKEQASYLRALGCTHLQGYYFARPLSADDLATYLEAEAAAS
jgi:diguanylate cyclase (GGDEF)-like protein/PAS domain S-box-containing protein